jgi:hypothetical protein
MFTVFSVDLSQLGVQNAFILFDLPQIITETSVHICILKISRRIHHFCKTILQFSIDGPNSITQFLAVVPSQ